MSFALKRHERLGHALHRLGEKQLGKAQRALTEADDPLDEVHAVRKATKRVRALLRVVRTGIKPARYHRINSLLRDAAAELSAGRDAQALVGTFDALVDTAPHGFVGQSGVRAELERRAQLAAEAFAADRELVSEATNKLDAARTLILRTAVDGDRRVLRAGLHDVYRHARRGHHQCDAAADDDDVAWHEWRKRTKHLWYAVQLIEGSSPAVVGGLATQLSHLADALGDDHDLAVLTELVHQRPWAFGDERARADLFALVASARSDLHRRALSAGSRLLVERPDAFTARMTATWDLWDDREELAVGGLQDIA